MNEIFDPEKDEVREYAAFPGIEVMLGAYHACHGRLPHVGEGEGFVIFCCREGRMECTVGDAYCYLSPGDLLICEKKLFFPNVIFPLRHYHGICIAIDTKTAPKCLSCFLKDVAVRPKNIERRFCEGRGFTVARADSAFRHIFSELYDVPDKIREGYLKVKILELMLFLSVYEVPVEETEEKTVSPLKVSLAKEAARYLAGRKDERVTLEQVALALHASKTTVKNAFSAVYGVSFYTYTKTLKMESAAYMLEYTDRTIGEIAAEHGYDNSSKFAAAFKSVKGKSPTEYRAEKGKGR